MDFLQQQIDAARRQFKSKEAIATNASSGTDSHSKKEKTTAKKTKSTFDVTRLKKSVKNTAPPTVKERMARLHKQLVVVVAPTITSSDPAPPVATDSPAVKANTAVLKRIAGFLRK